MRRSFEKKTYYREEGVCKLLNIHPSVVANLTHPEIMELQSLNRQLRNCRLPIDPPSSFGLYLQD